MVEYLKKATFSSGRTAIPFHDPHSGTARLACSWRDRLEALSHYGPGTAVQGCKACAKRKRTLHKPSPSERGRPRPRVPAHWLRADEGVRGPADRGFMVPKHDFDIVAAFHEPERRVPALRGPETREAGASRSNLAVHGPKAYAKRKEPPLNPGLVAQVGNLLCRRLAVGGAAPRWPRLRIANPRHSRLPVCATRPAAPVQGFNPRSALRRILTLNLSRWKREQRVEGQVGGSSRRECQR